MSRSINKTMDVKTKTLHAAVKLFLEKGYAKATVREIADVAGVNVSAMVRAVKSKENILCELIQSVLESQFEATSIILAGKTEDKILFYAAVITLQLYMVESGEHIRELYTATYSLPESSCVIQHTATKKVEQLFKEHLPGLETKDFYELGIASGGIFRGFMMTPCDMYFTMDRKVKRCLETTLRVYCVPDEKIREAIAFVSQIDYPGITQVIIDNLPAYLESKA